MAAHVFVSHAGMQHPLALALRPVLREAGFEPFVYDPRLWRPPAQFSDFGRSAWVDFETAGDWVNISHLREPIERSKCLLLLDDATRIESIESWHVRAEVMYAWWLSHWGNGNPSIVALPLALARTLVFARDDDPIRRSLPSLCQGAKPWVTYARARNAALAALAATTVAAVSLIPPASTNCLVAAFALVGTLLLAKGFREAFSLFLRAAYLGEVNSLSHMAIALVGHRSRPLLDLDARKALEFEINREVMIHATADVRLLALRVIHALPRLLLLFVMPAATLLAAATVLWGLLR